MISICVLLFFLIGFVILLLEETEWGQKIIDKIYYKIFTLENDEDE